MSKVSLKESTILLQDGTPSTPNELEIKIGDGNITWTEARTIEYTNDRGRISERRETDEVPMAVSLQFNWDYIKGKTGGGELPSPVDVLKKQGNASTWVSTDPDACQPYSIDIVIKYEPECTGAQVNETITLPKFVYESLDYDLDAGQIDVSGTCLATEALSERSDS
jgi:hypothetical protein